MPSPSPATEPRAGQLVGIAQEWRDGFRQLFSTPALSATVVVLLALGIGINAATFGAVRNVLLQPLPFPAPDRLTVVWWADKRSSSSFLGSSPVSGPNFLDWRSESRSFEQLVATRPVPVSLAGNGLAERLEGTETTAGLFEMLRATPSLGRTLTRDDEQPGRSAVAVVSDAFWRNRLAAVPDVLGRSVTLNGAPHIIVGVMPAGFQHPSPWSVGKPTDVWIPLPLDRLRADRQVNQFLVLGRLKPGVAREAAQGEMTGISERLVRAHPGVDNPGVALLIPLRQVLVGRLAGRLWMLLGASTLVLLVVTLNVAGVFVARAMRRRTETAIRASLGASRARLVRQFVIEHLPVCLLGGGASVLVAMTAARVLRALMPRSIPRVDEIRMDGWVLVATLGMSTAVALAASVVPALTASRRALADGLRQARGSAFRRSGGRRLLVVLQFALTLVLAHGAVLMLGSYRALRASEPGFGTDNVLTMALDVPPGGQRERVAAFFEEAARRVESLPGVARVGAINRLPLEGGSNNDVVVEGHDAGEHRRPLVEERIVTPGYFAAMGIRFLSGRTLEARDGAAGSLPVAVINQAMARRCWPDADPIGKSFRYVNGQSFTVVGVVADTRQWGIERPALPEAYSLADPGASPLKFLVVRADATPMSLLPAIRREIAKMDTGVPVAEVRTMGEVIDAAVEERRFGTALFGLFALTGLVLVATAVYALMSFFVTQRTPENRRAAGVWRHASQRDAADAPERAGTRRCGQCDRARGRIGSVEAHGGARVWSRADRPAHRAWRRCGPGRDRAGRGAGARVAGRPGGSCPRAPGGVSARSAALSRRGGSAALRPTPALPHCAPPGFRRRCYDGTSDKQPIPGGSGMATTPDSPLQAKSISPSFTVDDLQKSIRFFEGLGFGVEERWEDKGELLGVMLRAGAAHIGLSQDDWKRGRDRKKGVGMRVFVGTDQDIDGLAARAKAAGLTLDTEPHDTPWGSRAFEVTDPSGFKLTISSEA